MKKVINGQELNIPNHVAIILDGNGRWAKKRMLPRNVGHAQGAKNVEKICESCGNMGIKYLTVYAFSTENWKRPEDEVKALMKLLNNYLEDCKKIADKNNLCVKIIGDISSLDEKMQRRIKELEEASKDNDGLYFNVALNYGGRDEIVRAIKKIAKDCNEKEISMDEINQELVTKYLDTNMIPDPDLLIRTSGEQRISNFLLWQLAYTEFYFTDVFWPDFNENELIKAVEYYNKRERRFGGV